MPGTPPYEWTQSIPPLGKVFSPGLAGATTLNSPTGGCPSTWNKGLDHLCPPKKLASTTTCPVSFCFSCSNIYFVAFPLLDVSQDAFTTIILGAAPLFYCESIQFQAHFLSIFQGPKFVLLSIFSSNSQTPYSMVEPGGWIGGTYASHRSRCPQ